MYYILPKVINRFNAISIKISMAFFAEIKIYPKIHMESQRTSNSQKDFEKKNKTGGLTLPDFRICYKTNQNSMVLA